MVEDLRDNVKVLKAELKEANGRAAALENDMLRQQVSQASGADRRKVLRLDATLPGPVYGTPWRHLERCRACVVAAGEQTLELTTATLQLASSQLWSSYHDSMRNLDRHAV